MIVPTGINRKFLHWLARIKARSLNHALVGSQGDKNTQRYWIFKPDEYWRKGWGLVNALPWWMPFNVYLHRWDGSDTGYPHDHPRWSVTIVLRGRLWEQRPKKHAWLTPGSMVFRSHKFVHKILVPKPWARKTYTLFIVGRRRWVQSYYVKGKPVRVEDFERGDYPAPTEYFE